MPAGWPPLYHLYRMGGRLAGPILRRRLTAKHLSEGGARDRAQERFGRPTLPRPDGPVIWLHAVSVGEVLSVLDLADALAETAHVVLTTTSVTSATLVAGRLPDGVVHQFAPVDTAPAVRRFLAHWRPGLMVLTESETWPVTLAELSRRGVPVALVNARMSEQSAAQWTARAPRVARAALSRIALIRAQDQASAARYRRLGAPQDRVEVGGTLKAAAERLPVDEGARTAAAAWAAGRPIWLAASTHEGEEEMILSAHEILRRDLPDALLILAIRHPNRAEAVAALAGAPLARRSTGGLPEAGDAVYLADTLGEMGLWFDLCPCVLMGGSLIPGIGGHNPMEPAQFGCAILTGPHIENAADLYAALARDGTATVVDPAPEAIASAVAARIDAPRRVSEAARPDRGAVRALAQRLAGLAQFN